jgi:hypothetical protein
VRAPLVQYIRPSLLRAPMSCRATGTCGALEPIWRSVTRIVR